MRPALATAVLGLTLAVAAPTTWALTRPEASAGAPVESVLPAPASSAGGREAVGTLPEVTTRPATPDGQEQRPAPVRLSVPALGVDTTVDPVGVEPDGQMTIPAEVDRVGWYRFGPAPGDDGSAVIAGHVDDREQGLGAMAPLRDAQVGQDVAVTDASGTTTTWRIVSREVIQKQVLPLDRLFAREGPPRLTLITCGGPFLEEYASYRDNVVVVAEPLR
ncbi:class F sortase [Blastococcus tunisiensis]|uniref:Sortase family protein n=1 Tax=Blastococcus tunisiensis TaxID=1798228 RepID=A0A1I2MLD1_9ACTN|nr:class F sortase [Blastococcus sp. DSM 46838]SFF92314.1 Sortase family protein [Blastococcus sp. DSM 46838]